MNRPDDDVVVVTDAGISGTQDRLLRQRRYALTQGVRLVCFVLAVALPVPLWAKLILIVAAFTLPWLGVVAANGGPTVQRQRRRTATGVPLPVERPVRLALDGDRTIDHD